MIRSATTVTLDTSPDDSLVSGQAHGSEVKLNQDWSPRLVKLDGWANGARYQMNVDYDRHQANGNANGQTIALNFDMQQGSVQGRVGARSVDLVEQRRPTDRQLGSGRVPAENDRPGPGPFDDPLVLINQ